MAFLYPKVKLYIYVKHVITSLSNAKMILYYYNSLQYS